MNIMEQLSCKVVELTQERDALRSSLDAMRGALEKTEKWLVEYVNKAERPWFMDEIRAALAPKQEGEGK